MTYREKLKKLRMDRGLSLREVEAGTGVFYSSVNRLESFQDKDARVENIVRLARFYGVSLDWLFEEDFC